MPTSAARITARLGGASGPGSGAGTAVDGAVERRHPVRSGRPSVRAVGMAQRAEPVVEVTDRVRPDLVVTRAEDRRGEDAISPDPGPRSARTSTHRPRVFPTLGNVPGTLLDSGMPAWPPVHRTDTWCSDPRTLSPGPCSGRAEARNRRSQSRAVAQQVSPRRSEARRGPERPGAAGAAERATGRDRRFRRGRGPGGRRRSGRPSSPRAPAPRSSCCDRPTCTCRRSSAPPPRRR